MPLLRVWDGWVATCTLTALLLLMAPIAVHAQAVAGVSLSSNLPSPQAAGTTITWVANPSGGVNPLYRWYVSTDGGSSWAIVRDWAPSSISTYYDVYKWTPLTPNSLYRVAVWVKSTGSSVSTYEVVEASGYYAITAAPATPGRLARFTSSSGAVADSAVTEANGNIGIGTAAPAYRLDVQGGQLNASGGLCIAGDCRTSWGHVGGGTSGGGWTLSGSSTSFTGGNVGIGTTSPNVLFHVNNPGGVAITRLQGNGGSVQAIHGVGSDVFYFDTRNTGAMRIDPTTGTGIVLTTGGAVGLGLTNPIARLHVYGHAIIEGTTRLGSASAGAVEVRSGGPSVGILHPSVQNGSLLISDDSQLATRGLTLANLGNVGIGTATPQAKLHVAGNVIVDGNIGARYQDVAEWVESDDSLPAGTVVVADPDADNRVQVAATAYDTRVAGVVSAQPGVLLGEAGPGKIAVAQSGRVLVKVDASYGAIRRGDLLVASPTPGRAMRSEAVPVGGVSMHRPGTILGKALANLASGQGEVLAWLTLQ